MDTVEVGHIKGQRHRRKDKRTRTEKATRYGRWSRSERLELELDMIKDKDKANNYSNIACLIMTGCTPPLFFPTMPEIFRPCRIFLAVYPFQRRDFSHHAGSFPVIFPFPSLYTGKTISLLTEGNLAYIMIKKRCGCR